MLVTINTDASYSKAHRVGSYAFWIVCDGVRFFSAGPLKGAIESPSVAELMCIVKALVYLQQLQRGFAIKPVTKIIVNTDSMNSIHIFTGDKIAIQRYGLGKRQYKEVFDHWLRVKNILNGSLILGMLDHIRAPEQKDSM